MMPPTYYAFGCGFEVPLPATAIELVEIPVTIVTGNGHEITLPARVEAVAVPELCEHDN